MPDVSRPPDFLEILFSLLPVAAGRPLLLGPLLTAEFEAPPDPPMAEYCEED
jgi:hypothetical protein